jgi:uncharacterized coiled-coil protein SlyX
MRIIVVAGLTVALCGRCILALTRIDVLASSSSRARFDDEKTEHNAPSIFTLDNFLKLCNWGGVVFLGARIIRGSLIEENFDSVPSRDTHIVTPREMSTLQAEIATMKTGSSTDDKMQQLSNRIANLEEKLAAAAAKLDEQGTQVSIADLNYAISQLSSRLSALENVEMKISENNFTTAISELELSTDIQLKDIKRQTTLLEGICSKLQQDTVETALELDKLISQDLPPLFSNYEDMKSKQQRTLAPGKAGSPLKRNSRLTSSGKGAKKKLAPHQADIL